MSGDRIEVPSISAVSSTASNRLWEEYAMSPVLPLAGRNDSSRAEVTPLTIDGLEKDETAQLKELGPKLFPNPKPDSETAPDAPCDSETAPDAPRDDNRRRILPLDETPIEGNAQEMGSQVMKHLEKYRQWLKAHPPNIKLL